MKTPIENRESKIQNANTAPIDVQLRRQAGSVIAQIGTHTVARDNSALGAVRECAAKHYGVPERRIEIDFDRFGLITASLKPEAAESNIENPKSKISA
jgi:hypothetical protein